MVRFTPPVTLRLCQGEVMAWNQAPARVRVVAGRLWITQRNDPIDHFLHHGQCFELRRDTHTVMQADEDVWLRFERDPGWRHALATLWKRVRRLTGRATVPTTVAG